jgi:hypothetical protein
MQTVSKCDAGATIGWSRHNYLLLLPAPLGEARARRYGDHCHGYFFAAHVAKR